MKCRVNDVEVSQGNLSDMDWTFAEIIERASYGVDLYPGDVIGSGTVGTGCFLELNGTGKLNDPNYAEQWLKAGDVIEMEIDGLGKLSNTIVAEESGWSILANKKVKGWMLWVMGAMLDSNWKLFFMGKIISFEDLIVWQKAQELAVKVYELAELNKFIKNDFTLKTSWNAPPFLFQTI